MLFLILFGFFCCALTSLSFGLAATRALGVPLEKGEALALGYVIGSAIVSTLTLALGSIGAITQTLVVTVAILCLLLLWSLRKWFKGLAGASMKSVPGWVKAILVVTAASYGVLYFRQALSPEMSPDGMAYHLGLVNLWANAGRIYRMPDMLEAMPQGIEMLFFFAFVVGRHSAAALVHLSFLFDLPIMMLLYGHRFGWSYFATTFAAVLVFTSPLFGIDGTVAYVDVALAAVVFATLYLLQIWRQNRNAGALVACGITAGFALAIKYSAAPLLLFVVAVVLWEVRKTGWTKMARIAVLPLFAIALLSGPYFLRNWIWFQNPIAFLGNAIFPNPWFHVSLERSFTAQSASYNGVTWRDLPIGLTIGNSKFPNSFGTVFLLLPLSVFGMIWRPSRIFTVAALVLATVYLGGKDPRYLIPAVPLATMALGFVLNQISGSSSLLCAIIAVHLIVSWPAFMNWAHFPRVWQWRINPVSWREALRITPESEYLKRIPDYVMARNIEALVPPEAPVLAFTGGAAQSYTTRWLVVCWRSAYGERMADLLFSKWHSPQDKRERFFFTVPPVPLKAVRIVQDAGNDRLMWNVDEVELRSEGKLLPVSSKWRLNAFPNPWDVRAAFDGRLATRWRSWDSLWPGMFINIDFGKNQTLDSVSVVTDNREWTTLQDGPWAAQVSLDLVTSEGRKMQLKPQVTWDAPIDLRKDATRVLKENGIRYLLINRSDWMQHEFRDEPSVWGMHAIAATADATLYEID